MSATNTVELTKPLMTHKGSITKIELKEPRARSFLNHDEPYKANIVDGFWDFDFKGHQKSIMGFLEDMTGLDQITLEDLSSNDFILLRLRAAFMIQGLVGSENPPV